MPWTRGSSYHWIQTASVRSRARIPRPGRVCWPASTAESPRSCSCACSCCRSWRWALRGPGRLAGADRQALLPGWAFWGANVVAAVLFGLGHLPATAALLPLTPLIVVRAVVLNGVAAIPFGWLFRRRGIEIAMAAHFTTVIVLHVILPLVA